MEYVREQRPFFLVAQTYRFRAHSMYDAELYRSKDEVERWKERDPILLWRNKLIDEGVLDEAGLSAIESKVAKQVNDAVKFAEAGLWEPVEDLTKDVYTPVTP
jgi:pyruvate dehydrogenase E1 component alpha subunit